ncbi:MAG: glycosyltransferase family 9 protein [Gemmatimonadaceae bacterium]
MTSEGPSGLTPPERVLLVQIRRLGDVVLTMPLLGDLRRAFPSARLDFLVGDSAAPLLANHPHLDERVLLDRDHPLRMWNYIRARRYDWIVDVQSSPRTAPIAMMSGARVRIGWDVTGWGWVYTHRLSRSGRPAEYVLRERRRLLELAGVPVSDDLPRLYVTTQERAQGEVDLIATGARAGSPRVGFLLSAGEPSKEWRLEGFAELAESLSAMGIAPVLFQPPGDTPVVARLLALTKSVNVLPILELRRFLAALAGCDALVSGDTGPAHMARALGVPTATIFGPSSPVLWSPTLPTAAVVRDERVPCLTCQLNICPIGHDCMVGVTSSMVLARVHEILGNPRPSRTAAV